jgi:hypothetical protein
MVPDWVVWLSLGVAVAGLLIGLVFGLSAWLNQRPSNELSLRISKPLYGDAAVLNLPGPPVARFFHVTVKNSDKERDAQNCCVYLTSLKQKGIRKELLTQPLPLKWRGVPTFPSQSVPAGSERKFDAFMVLHTQPDHLLLNAFVDSSQLVPNIIATGDFVATYRVTAEGFATNERKFTLHLDANLADATIRKQ